MEKSFKIMTLCCYRRNEGLNNYSIEFCRINANEYAVYTHQKGVAKCVCVDSDYARVKEYYKRCLLVNF